MMRKRLDRVRQTAMGRYRRLSAYGPCRHIEGAMIFVPIDRYLTRVHIAEDEARREVAEIDRRPFVHLAHVSIANPPRLAARHHGQDPFVEAIAMTLDVENGVDAVAASDEARQKRPLPAPPGVGRVDGVAEADIHVGFLEQDIALDQQLLGKARPVTLSEQLGPLLQQIIRHPDRIECDVGGGRSKSVAGRPPARPRRRRDASARPSGRCDPRRRRHRWPGSPP